ncbi:MAG: HEAT repeat domain-containing protein [Vicinamibacterales bacterium]
MNADARRSDAGARGTILLCVLASLTLPPVAGAQVRIDNATVTRHTAAAGLERTFRPLVKSTTDPFWIAYAVPVVDGDRVMCCWTSSSGTTWIEGGVAVRTSSDACCGACSIEPGRNDGINISSRDRTTRPVQLEASRFTVFYRIVSGAVERIRVFSEECGLDAGGRAVQWIDDVKPSESVGLLMSLADKSTTDRVVDASVTAIALHADQSADAALEVLVGRDRPERLRKKAAFWLGQARGRRGFDTLRRLVADDPSTAFRKSAVFALSQSGEADAVPTLIQLAKRDTSPEIRGEALFWLAQKAGRKAAEAITDAIENDPETDVKKRAVFALSQLPKDEGVPLLIQIARGNRNPAVRKQAIFWLGQSKDPRALAFFEEVLK